MWGRLMLASETCSERVRDRLEHSLKNARVRSRPLGGRMQISEQIACETEGMDLETPESAVRGGRGSPRKSHLMERGDGSSITSRVSREKK